MGKRGTRKEGPFESPTPEAGHMPAKSPRGQKDFSGSAKRGIHESDFSGNRTTMPRELRPNIDQGGDTSFSAAKGPISNRNHDPRRSHS